MIFDGRKRVFDDDILDVVGEEQSVAVEDELDDAVDVVGTDDDVCIISSSSSSSALRSTIIEEEDPEELLFTFLLRDLLITSRLTISILLSDSDLSLFEVDDDPETRSSVADKFNLTADFVVRIAVKLLLLVGVVIKEFDCEDDSFSLDPTPQHLLIFLFPNPIFSLLSLFISEEFLTITPPVSFCSCS